MPIEMSKYSNQNISFMYPDILRQLNMAPGVRDESGSLILAVFQQPRPDVPGLTITCMEYDLAGRTLEELGDQQLPDASKEKTTVGDREAILAREEVGTVVGPRQTVKVFVRKDDTRVYSLSCSVDVREYSAHQETIEKIISSFHVAS